MDLTWVLADIINIVKLLAHCLGISPVIVLTSWPEPAGQYQQPPKSSGLVHAQGHSRQLNGKKVLRAEQNSS